MTFVSFFVCFFIVYGYVYGTYVGGHMCACMCTEARRLLLGPVFSFYSIDFGDWAQVTSLDDKYLYPPNHLVSNLAIFILCQGMKMIIWTFQKTKKSIFTMYKAHFSSSHWCLIMAVEVADMVVIVVMRLILPVPSIKWLLVWNSPLDLIRQI